jgi:hypothetical protein
MSQYYTDENEASDGTDGIQALGAELTDDDAPVVEETPEEQENTAEAKKEAKASSKTPVPEDHMAPVEFARMCDPDMKPQVMYGYVMGGDQPGEGREGHRCGSGLHSVRYHRYGPPGRGLSVSGELRVIIPSNKRLIATRTSAPHTVRDRAVWQLAWLITKRSWVRIPLPLQSKGQDRNRPLVRLRANLKVT